LYDSSTFDTDPFEPQPDGRHTMFPFRVHAQMTIALLLYNQCVTALQEVTLTSLHSPAGFHMAETFSIAYETLPAEA